MIDRPDADLLDPAITELLTTWGCSTFADRQLHPIVAAASGGVVLTGEGGDESRGGWSSGRQCTHWMGTRAGGLAASSPRPKDRWRSMVSAAPAADVAHRRVGTVDEALTCTEVEPVGWRSPGAVFARRQRARSAHSTAR